MRFRTELNNFPSPFTIGYAHKMVLMGSCFADEIGTVLNDLKFNALSNPLGTIYNPLILCKLLMKVIHNEKYTEKELVLLRGQYYHHDLHSSFTENSSENFLKKISDTQEKLLISLKTADFLFMTLGSSIAYVQNKNDEMVGNCHKVASTEFTKVDIGIDEIVGAIHECYAALKLINPKLKLILTVSPVRHIKEGIIENTRSKARLLESVNKLSKETEISYFPAYELMMDDLRDYRFYAADLVHPNSMAIKYIWAYFKSHYMQKETMQLVDKIVKVLKSASHRPFNPDTDSFKNFVHDTIEKMDMLEAELARELFRVEKEKLIKSIG